MRERIWAGLFRATGTLRVGGGGMLGSSWYRYAAPEIIRGEEKGRGREGGACGEGTNVT